MISYSQKQIVSPKNQLPINQEAGYDLHHGDVVIAAITSCTNTSNPSVLMTAGLLAKKASEKGLKQKPWVKTSLAPGSQVVKRYLEEAGLQTHLDHLGFATRWFAAQLVSEILGPYLKKWAVSSQKMI